MSQQPGQPAVECDAAFVENSPADARWTYPSVFVGEDRVIVAYSAAGYLEEREDIAQMYRSAAREMHGRPDLNTSATQRRKILPLKWFYGGRDPADHPGLKPGFAPVSRH